MKPNINSAEVHPQLSNKKHPVDGALVGAGSPLWPFFSFFFSSSSSSYREVNRIVIYGFCLLLPPQSFCSFLIRNLSLYFLLYDAYGKLIYTQHHWKVSIAKSSFFCFCSVMLFVNLLLFLLHNHVFTLPSSFQTQTRPVLHTSATAQKNPYKRSLSSCSQKFIISHLNDLSKPCHKFKFHHQVVPRVLTNPLMGHRRHSAWSTLSVESQSQKIHFLPALHALFSLCSALPCPALRCSALISFSLLPWILLLEIGT